MSVLKPRNRLVYFRVSDDEFRRFNHVCESIGARSLSDLARFAVENLIQEGNTHTDHITAKLAVLEAIVNDLNNKVHEMSVSLGQHLSVNAGFATRVQKPDQNIVNLEGGGDEKIY